MKFQLLEIDNFVFVDVQPTYTWRSGYLEGSFGNEAWFHIRCCLSSWEEGIWSWYICKDIQLGHFWLTDKVAAWMKEHIFQRYSDSLREWFKLLLKIMGYIFYVDTSSSIWVYWHRQNSSRSMACLIGRCQSWRAKHHSFGLWYKFVWWGLYISFALRFAHFFHRSSRCKSL